MKTIIVAGAVGVIGRGVLAHFEQSPDVELIAISRREPDFPTRARHISVDLSDLAACQRELGSLNNVTHIVYAAYQEHASAADQITSNLGMLKNLVDVVEECSPALQHITLMEGGKAYGAHIGAFPSPAKEDDPRHMPPNFYYDQEDFLRDRSVGKDWSWTAFRPEAVAGFATGNPMNLLMVIAVYGTLARKLNVPLSFPGTPASYNALYQVTDTRLLASATEWAGDNELCRGEVYNITNGDYFRWSRIWPRIAEFFGVPTGEPFNMSLQEVMADKALLWDELVREHELKPYSYKDIVSWRFGDAIFKTTYDNISSTIKARQHGFPDCIDTGDMYLELLQHLRDECIIP
jgi:nucleoside-diphosphate-sugar epimerase